MSDERMLEHHPEHALPERATIPDRGRSPAEGLQRSVGNHRLVQLRRTLRAGAVQARGELAGPDIHAAAAHGISGAGGALPHLEAIQRAFGHHDVGGVRAHVGGASTEAADAMGALAYASGDDVAFADAPDLHLAAHEAAHVVQQRAGVRLSDGVGSSGDEYERHADAVADLVVRGESAEALLDQYAHRGAAGGPAVQRQVVQRQEQTGGEAAGEGGQCSDAPSDNLDVTRATSAMRSYAERHAGEISTQVPNDALDSVSEQIERLVAERRTGSTRTAGANLMGTWWSYQWNIRADVQKRRVGVCGQQRLNNATIRHGDQQTARSEQRAEDGDQRTQGSTGSLQSGVNADNGPTSGASMGSQSGGQQSRTRGSTRGSERVDSTSVEGQGDTVLQEEEWEYTVTWTVETRVAEGRPPGSGWFGEGNNDWSLGNSIGRAVEDAPSIHRESTPIGTFRQTSRDDTPGPRPEQPRRPARRRVPQRIE